MAPSAHPEFATILKAMSGHSVPAGDVTMRRNVMDPVAASMNQAVKAAHPELESQVNLITHLVPTPADGHNVPVLHYSIKASNTDTPTAAVLNMHAGGLITGSAKSMDASIRRHVLETGVPIFDVEYRLAPEHPYPTPQEDSWAALVWLHDHAAELGVDPTRIALMGESAGGCLATGLALHALVKNIPIARLILICPMLDDKTGQETREFGTQYTWTSEDNTTAWDAVLGENRRDSFPEGAIPAVPARANPVGGLPRTLLQVAGGDLFLDEDLAFGNLMAKQGVDVDMITYAGVPHGFDTILPDCEPSQRARRDRNRVLGEL